MQSPILYTENLSSVVQSGEEKLTILHDITFSINPTETVAIQGPSGSGKSTLLALLAGLDHATAGTIYLKGQALHNMKEAEKTALRARLIGFIFQSFQLIPSFTALENVSLPLELHHHAKAETIAKDWLVKVGLEKRMHHYPSQLSGGEQQRVAIARAFVLQPELLLADEPTGNLDPKTGTRIIDLLWELNQEHGTTLLIVTHDAAIAKRCQRQFELIEGCLKT